MPARQIKVQAFLANLPMFSEMSTAELDRIAAGTLTVHAAKGETIVHTGDPCTGFHVVVYGQVKLGFTSPQGVEKVVEIVRPGQTFGEALMFMGQPYVVMAQTLADSLLLHVAREVVLDELELVGSRATAGEMRRVMPLVEQGRISKVLGFRGLERIPVDEADFSWQPITPAVDEARSRVTTPPPEALGSHHQFGAVLVPPPRR